VEIAAWRRADLLVIEVRDDGRGVRGEPRGHGVGLRNTRDRLRQLYGESASRFVLRGRVGGGAIAALSIPYRPAPAPRAAAAELAARLA
jgi:LytS/YehU family sensor histidine kinase